jgi:hypothetical protein
VLEAAESRRDAATLAAFAMGAAGVDEALNHTDTLSELHVPCFATDAYGRYALGEDWPDMRRRIERAQRLAHAKGVKVTVGLGTSLGCPIDPSHRLSDTIARFRDLVSLGVDCIMFGDTAGRRRGRPFASSRHGERRPPAGDRPRALPRHARARAAEHVDRDRVWRRRRRLFAPRPRRRATSVLHRAGPP